MVVVDSLILVASEHEMRFLRKVAGALARIGVRRDALVIVALSGGADSVALVRAMLALRETFGYRLVAAHLNHRIRGAESGRDEAFVRALGARLGIEVEVERAEGLTAGTPNLEERAREYRYGFFERLAERRHADYVALAHQADDQAETVMLRLLRGAGASGLSAMGERGPGRIIRPMLTVTRAEVLEYRGAIDESFVSDSTNVSREILRNRVRMELLPMLEREYAPGLGGRLCELADEMREVDDFLRIVAGEEMARRMGADGALALSGFARLHPALQRVLVRLFIESRIGSLRRISRAHVEAIRRLCSEGPSNASLDLPHGTRAVRVYDRLSLGPARVSPSPRFSVPIAPSGTTVVCEAGFAFEAETLAAKQASLPANKWQALFDAREVTQGFVVRNFRHGDRINPLGMKGHRKVKDVFIDARIPRAGRTTFPLVESGGELVWIPGLVRAGKAAVGEGTETVLRLTAHRLQEPSQGK